MFPVESLIRKQGGRYRDRTICYSQAEKLTYGAFSARSIALTRELTALGMTPGSRAVVLMREQLEVVPVYGACACGGFSAVPLAPRSSSDEVSFALQDTGARAMVCCSELRDVAESAIMKAGLRIEKVRDCGAFQMLSIGSSLGEVAVDIPRSEDEILVIPYTSGSTGQPKGVPQTQLAHMENAFDYAYFYGLSERSVIMSSFPHYSGLLIAALMPALLVGGSIVLMPMPPWRAENFFHLAKEYGVTHTEVVPTQLQRMVEYAGDDSGLRTLQGLAYGSAPTSSALVDCATERFGAILIQMYGLTEALSLSAGLSRFDHADDELRNTIGFPIGRTRMWLEGPDGQILGPNEQGMLMVSSPKVCRSYWNRPDESARTFLHRGLVTGDVAYMTDRGAFAIVDREKDIIKSGGFAVSPAEVDNVLQKHRDVANSLTFGVPDSEWGERVVAACVLRDGVQAPKVTLDLALFCREHLLPYKVPKEFYFLKSLPLSNVGKVARKNLVDQYVSGTLADPRGGMEMETES